MKTHLKTLLLIAISLMATVGLNAQEPFFFTKNGLKITLAEKDGKGKINGYTQSTVVSVEGEPSNCTVVYKLMVMDNKKKPLLNEEMDMKIYIKAGVVTFDPTSLAGKLMEGMTVSGDNLILPADVAVGDVLKDYTITVSIGAMKTTTANSDIKVTGEETLDIGGTAIDCLIVESTVLAKVIGIKQQMKQKIWYGRGIGPVKTETYNKKGKLMSVQEIVEIEGF